MKTIPLRRGAKVTLKAALQQLLPNRAVCGRVCDFMKFVPPGHFYSPIPSSDDERSALATASEELPGIDLREEAQVEWLERLAPFYGTIPDFSYEPSPHYRFSYNNHYYSYADATILTCLLQHSRPQRFIDVGGGFTTALVLDLNDALFPRSRIQVEVIEPHPELLRSLLRENDPVIVHPEKVQNLAPRLFQELEPDDVLFLDSTHVSKLGSEVNYLMFRILPQLKPGVRVHVHEAFFPFEYPREFFAEGKYWNELYLWRAFLMHNSTYQIEIFNSYLEHTRRPLMQQRFPRYFEIGDPAIAVQRQGSSLWLRKQ